MTVFRILGVAAVVILARLTPAYGGDGPVAWWSFDDGTAIDVTGNGHDGTIYGALPVHGLAQDGGAEGIALSFDGIDDYVDFGNASDLNPATAVSVVAWVRPVSFSGSGNDPVVDKAYSSHGYPYYQYHLGVIGDRYWTDQAAFNFTVTAGDDAQYAWTGPGFWTPEGWYFLVGTYDGQAVRLYVNGSLVDSTPLTGEMTDYGKSLLVGAYANYPAFLPGTIDELRLYNRALSQSEIDSLYLPIAASGVRDVSPAQSDLAIVSHPNPSSGHMVIDFEVTHDARFLLTAFDAAGRKVATLLDAHLSPGSHRVSWDGQGANGLGLRTGVYFLHLLDGDASGCVRTLIVR